MRAAVLIHGGHHGGWCWGRTIPGLRAAGWTVEAPSLPGLGDQSHLSSPAVTLQTHIDAVLALISARSLTDVVLVGHSAAGMVISGVADLIPKRIRALVYLDAIIPRHGESLFDILGHDSAMVRGFKERATEEGAGWLIPVAEKSAESFGVSDPQDAKWVNQQLAPQPIGTFSEKIRLTGHFRDVETKIYVRCDKHADRPHLDKAADFAKREPGWTVEHWSSVHDVMVTEPERVVAFIENLAPVTPTSMTTAKKPA